MKEMWCWRCKQDVMMLDEEEYKRVNDLYYLCIKSVKKYKEENGVSLNESPIDKLFEPVRLEYEKITGIVNCYHNAIMHHRISLYGEQCISCGKPLRTPLAKICAKCGVKVKQVEMGN